MSLSINEVSNRLQNFKFENYLREFRKDAIFTYN